MLYQFQFTGFIEAFPFDGEEPIEVRKNKNINCVVQPTKNKDGHFPLEININAENQEKAKAQADDFLAYIVHEISCQKKRSIQRFRITSCEMLKDGKLYSAAYVEPVVVLLTIPSVAATSFPYVDEGKTLSEKLQNHLHVMPRGKLRKAKEIYNKALSLDSDLEQFREFYQILLLFRGNKQRKDYWDVEKYLVQKCGIEADQLRDFEHEKRASSQYVTIFTAIRDSFGHEATFNEGQTLEFQKTVSKHLPQLKKIVEQLIEEQSK